MQVSFSSGVIEQTKQMPICAAVVVAMKSTDRSAAIEFMAFTDDATRMVDFCCLMSSGMSPDEAFKTVYKKRAVNVSNQGNRAPG